MNIFNGIDENNLNELLKCLNGVRKSYFKDEVVINVGDRITAAAYILEGSIQVAEDDFDGNKIIISKIEKGETFGLASVCAGLERSTIYAIATQDTKLLFLDYNRILSVCTNSCPFHRKLIQNIIKVLADKNLFLQERIILLSKKSLRDRILFFLNMEKKVKNKIFEVPYSREQMAEFLGSNRSALSRELAKMKSEQLIDYHKNSFKIIKLES